MKIFMLAGFCCSFLFMNLLHAQTVEEARAALEKATVAANEAQKAAEGALKDAQARLGKATLSFESAKKLMDMANADPALKPKSNVVVSPSGPYVSYAPPTSNPQYDKIVKQYQAAFKELEAAKVAIAKADPESNASVVEAKGKIEQSQNVLNGALVAAEKQAKDANMVDLLGKAEKSNLRLSFLLRDFDFLKQKFGLIDVQIEAAKDRVESELDRTLMGEYVTRKMARMAEMMCDENAKKKVCSKNGGDPNELLKEMDQVLSPTRPGAKEFDRTKAYKSANPIAPPASQPSGSEADATKAE